MASVAANMPPVTDVRIRRRSGPAGIEVTEPAIAGENMRPAFFERVILTVVVYGAGADGYGCAPWPLVGLRALRRE